MKVNKEEFDTISRLVEMNREKGSDFVRVGSKKELLNSDSSVSNAKRYLVSQGYPEDIQLSNSEALSLIIKSAIDKSNLELRISIDKEIEDNTITLNNILIERADLLKKRSLLS